MGDLNQDSYELMMTLLSGFSSSMQDWVKFELSRAQTKEEARQIAKTLQHVLRDEIPCIQAIPPEAQAEKKQLYDMIKKYNKEHPKEPIKFVAHTYKDSIACNGVVHKAGTVFLYCNQADYDKISNFTKEIFKSKDINIQEISNERFMQQNINKDAIKISNISSNEMNILKTRPWAHDSYDEAIKSLSFSFSSVPKKDSTYDIYVNSNDTIGKSNVLKLYENLFLSKALLSGPDGAVKNQQMNYERDLLKHAMNVAKGSKTNETLYITSAIDSGRYMTIESGKLKVFETGFSLKNFCGRKTLEISLDDLEMDSKTFSAELLSTIKSFKNPVMLSSLNDCAIHCKTGEVVKECLDINGNIMEYPALTEDILKKCSPEAKCSFLQNIFEIAKKDLEIKGLALDGKNFITECDKVVKAFNQAKIVMRYYDNLLNDIEEVEKAIEKTKNLNEQDLAELDWTEEKRADVLKTLEEKYANLTKDLKEFEANHGPDVFSTLQSEELSTAEKIRRLIVDNPNCGVDTPGFISKGATTNFEEATKFAASIDIEEITQIVTEVSTIEIECQKLSINEHFVETTLADEAVDRAKQRTNTERLEWEYDNFDSFSDILSEEIKDVDRSNIIVGQRDEDASFINEEFEEEIDENEEELDEECVERTPT